MAKDKITTIKVTSAPLPTLVLSKPDVITVIFALRNYIPMLEAEIKEPTRPHGPAESAMALADAQPLLKLLEIWAARNR